MTVRIDFPFPEDAERGGARAPGDAPPAGVTGFT